MDYHLIVKYMFIVLTWDLNARAQFAQHRFRPGVGQFGQSPLTSIQTSIQTVDRVPSRALFLQAPSRTRGVSLVQAPALIQSRRSQASRRTVSHRRGPTFGGAVVPRRRIFRPSVRRQQVAALSTMPLSNQRDYVHIDEVVALASQLLGMRNMGDPTADRAMGGQTRGGAITAQAAIKPATAAILPAVAPVTNSVTLPAIVATPQKTTAKIAPAAAPKATGIKTVSVAAAKTVSAPMTAGSAGSVFGSLGAGMDILSGPGMTGMGSLMSNILMSSSDPISPEIQQAAAGLDLNMMTSEEQLRRALDKKLPRETISTGNVQQDRLLTKLLEDRRQNMIEDTAETIRKKMMNI